MTNSFEIRIRNILSIYLYVLRLMLIMSMTGYHSDARRGCGDNGHFLDVTLLNGMKLACKLYLGFPVFYLPHRNTCIPCPYYNKGDLDIYGDHAIVCAGQIDSSFPSSQCSP
jgi:hypothetical protein